MQNLQRLLSRLSISPSARKFESISIPGKEFFSTDSGGGSRGDGWKEWDSVDSSGSGGGGGSGFGFDSVDSWSTGLTELDFEGKEGGLQVAPPRGSTGGIVSKRQSVPMVDDVEADIAALEEHNREFSEYVNSWPERMKEVNMLLKQVNEPGVRGSYLKDSEKAEMYRLHKENPTVYTIEKLAKDYRIMRQRVHAILWLKEEEEKEEKELGHPLDDSVELLLDTCPEFFNSHDREFHVATLPYKPDFKIMPEGWDGTTRDLDEVHYEISQKEDEMLYQEFVQRMNFNKKKMAGEVKVHKYSRRRSDEGWNFTVEKLGPRGKRGGGGGWKFVSLPDGSSRPLNEMERMYVKRETVKRRRKIVP